MTRNIVFIPILLVISLIICGCSTKPGYGEKCEDFKSTFAEIDSSLIVDSDSRHVIGVRWEKFQVAKRKLETLTEPNDGSIDDEVLESLNGLEKYLYAGNSTIKWKTWWLQENSVRPKHLRETDLATGPYLIDPGGSAGSDEQYLYWNDTPYMNYEGNVGVMLDFGCEAKN